MSFIEILLIGIGLSMDAFAVSICKGLWIKEDKCRKSIIIGAYFGIFQALMPSIGYMLGSRFQTIVESIDHWIAFILLFVIGIKMIKESKNDDSEDTSSSNTDLQIMLPLAIATSIDALAIGITFSFLQVRLLISVIIIGITTFVISAIGVALGNKFGNKLQNKAQILGGAILIVIGAKILIEHLGIVNLFF